MQPQIQHQLCSHISKLSKQSIQQLQKSNYIGVCSHCKQILHNNEQTNLLYDVNVNLNICLHCAAIFCLKNDGRCLYQHLDQKHVFWGKFRVKKQVPSLTLCSEGQVNTNNIENISEIMCKYCGSINKQLSMANTDCTNQQFQKLTRFSNFITPILHNLPTIIHKKFQQNEQLTNTSEIGVFGLANLGNTCFLNSILQILFYTHPLVELYGSLAVKQIKQLYLISQDKNKRKQMQYFYDQTIDKFEANSWHVVGDRKKNKQKLKNNNMEKFVADGLVKDSKFNTIFRKFISNAANQVNMQSMDIILEPVQLLTKLGEFDPKYKMQQEQDAEELLVFIIDLLSQGEMADVYASQKDAKQRYQKIEQLLGRQKLSPIQQIFGSYLASRIVCHGCKSQSWSIDFTYHYPIPLQPPSQKHPTFPPTSPQTTLKIPTYPKQLKYPQSSPSQDLAFKNILDPLLCPQRLTNKDNYYNCQKCGHLSGTKQFYILDNPQILVISLKRFQYGKKFKINKFVQFTEEVDIGGYLLREVDQDGNLVGDSCRYSIYGVVVHKGQTINSGHYICYVKVNRQKQKPVWVQFSDEKARKVTSKQVYRQQAYMLLYRKVSNSESK